MDKYLNSYREMIPLRGLTNHTLRSYCTYIRAYLDYLTSIFHKSPEDVSWDELRDYIRWFQRSRSLSDRTINGAISQLRSFILYVLYKSWDGTQLPMHRFDKCLSYIPSEEETWRFISSMPDLKQKTMVTIMYSSGLCIGEVYRLCYKDADYRSIRLYISHGKDCSARYAIPSRAALDLLTPYWFEYDRPMGYLFPKQHGRDRPIDTFFLSGHTHAHEDKLGWEYRVTYHPFRRVSGTHLCRGGVDLLTIKALMGHKSLTSTTICVHLAASGTSSAVNPFDRLAGVCHKWSQDPADVQTFLWYLFYLKAPSVRYTVESCSCHPRLQIRRTGL